MIKQLGIIPMYTDKMVRKHYSHIEKYLENILNSPSTINRVMKYYQVGFSEDHTKMYLLFKNEIIKTYGISVEDYYRDLRMELWCDIGLTVIPPAPIIGPIWRDE